MRGNDDDCRQNLEDNRIRVDTNEILGDANVDCNNTGLKWKWLWAMSVLPSSRDWKRFSDWNRGGTGKW